MPRKAKDKQELIEEKELKKRTKKISSKADDSISTKKTTNTRSKKTNLTDKSTTTKSSSTKATTSKKSKKADSAEKSTTVKKRSTKSTASTTAVKSPEDFLVEYYDLPYKYNKTVVKLLAQTPETLFVYWEISDEDKNYFIEKYGENFFETSTPILKIHNKTKNYTYEVEINDFANCWYLHVNDSKCEYQIELDRKINTFSNNEYVYISSSNNLESPNNHILFEQNLSKVQFKNVKTNELKDIDITKNIEKIYNIENWYKLFYTEEDLKHIKDLSNPSSGNPTSTFK